jgi:hypothetical protein
MMPKFTDMHWLIKSLILNVILITIAIVMISSVKSSCNQTREGNYIEVQRVTSPDSLLDAIIFKNENYDVKNGMMVSIEFAGDKSKSFDSMEFSADKVHGLSVRWINSNLLEIHYTKARIFAFRNIWTDRGFGPLVRTVEIALVKDGDEQLDILHD